MVDGRELLFLFFVLMVQMVFVCLVVIVLNVNIKSVFVMVNYFCFVLSLEISFGGMICSNLLKFLLMVFFENDNSVIIGLLGLVVVNYWWILMSWDNVFV